MLANHVYFLRESIFETMERNDVFQSRAVKSVEKNVEDTSQSNLARREQLLVFFNIAVTLWISTTIRKVNLKSWNPAVTL